jgi:hypothetical protein
LDGENGFLQKVDGCEEENAMKLFDPSLRFHMGIAATNQCTKFQTLSTFCGDWAI